jgi:hypothetical protein
MDLLRGLAKTGNEPPDRRRTRTEQMPNKLRTKAEICEARAENRSVPGFIDPGGQVWKIQVPVALAILSFQT